MTEPTAQCYHEAGHAVADARMNVRIKTVTQSYVETRDTFGTIGCDRLLVILLAGGAAERVLTNAPARFDGEDMRIARVLLGAFSAPLLPLRSEIYQRLVDAGLVWWSAVAEAEVRRHWPAIERVARALASRGTLTESQLLECLGDREARVMA